MNDRLKFWQREPTEETEEVTSVEYPIDTVEEEAPDRNILMLVALGIAALAFVILVVLLGSWAYHRGQKPKSTPVVTRPAGVSITDNTAGNQRTNSGSGPAGKTQSGTTTSNAPSTGGTADANSASGQPQASQLPNSGPGDVVAMFIGATILASVSHFALSRRAASFSE